MKRCSLSTVTDKKKKTERKGDRWRKDVEVKSERKLETCVMEKRKRERETREEWR